MPEIMRVHLGANSYDIKIGNGLIDRIGAEMTGVLSARRVLVVSDENVWTLYGARALASLHYAGFQADHLVLPAGETTKSLANLPVVYSAMIRAGLTRTDAAVALGGGVIGDLTGFAAATYLRGIACVQIPTSLLAQVDSSVGGKVAVDLPEGKNLAGAFHQPRLVLIDPEVLNTLPIRFFQDGMGEVVKYGCIRDEALFELCLRPDRMDMGEVIRRCLEIKRALVEADERDTGARMLLNFGHTLGHAIELAQHYEGLTHGEAVAAGMALITRMSEKIGLTQAGTCDRLLSGLIANGLPAEAPDGLWAQMRAAIARDKKNLDNRLTVVLLEKIGRGILYPTTAAFFEEVFAWLR